MTNVVIVNGQDIFDRTKSITAILSSRRNILDNAPAFMCLLGDFVSQNNRETLGLKTNGKYVNISLTFSTYSKRDGMFGFTTIEYYDRSNKKVGEKDQKH